MPDCHVARDFSEKSETKNLITTKGPRRLELFQEKCKNGLTLGGTVDSYEMHVNFWIRFNRTFNVWEQFTFYTVSVPQTMISGHALVVLVGPTWSWAYFLEVNLQVFVIVTGTFHSRNKRSRVKIELLRTRRLWWYLEFVQKVKILHLLYRRIKPNVLGSFMDKLW